MTRQHLQMKDQRREDMADIDDEIVFCRARGLGGHAWPKLRPGKKLPSNFRPEPAPNGAILVTETCRACGKTRWYLSAAKGIFDLGSKKHYKDPPNWKVLSRDLGYSSRDFDAEAWSRMQDDIMAAAQRNARVVE